MRLSEPQGSKATGIEEAAGMTANRSCNTREALDELEPKPQKPGSCRSQEAKKL